MISELSICTSSMNRSELLLKAIESWVVLKAKEIIIVDWSSKDSVADLLIERYKDPRIKVLRVDGKQFYNHGKAANLKLRCASSKYLLNVDCDILLDTGFLEFYQEKDLDDKSFFHGSTKVDPGTAGTCLMHRNMFYDSNGYHELMEGWGFNDTDFYLRSRNKGYIENDLHPSTVTHIPHDNEARMENFEDKSGIRVSEKKNIDLRRKTPWTLEHKMEVQEFTVFSYGSAPEKKLL